MVIGGQAVLVYGEPRLTKDIDITLGIRVDRLGELLRLAGNLKLRILVDDHEDFVKKTMVLPVLDNKSGIRIDFIFSFSPYEQQAIEGAKKVKIGNTYVKFASLEDVIIHKIIAGRPRDIEDVKSILLKNPRYKNQYIVKWLKVFDNSLGTNFLKSFRKILREME
jgi:hypothetical protein